MALVLNRHQSYLGVIEYEVSCLSCHGDEGRGDGPDAEFLENEPADLTGIAKALCPRRGSLSLLILEAENISYDVPQVVFFEDEVGHCRVRTLHPREQRHRGYAGRICNLLERHRHTLLER
jgi:hypothetical protein